MNRTMLAMMALATFLRKGAIFLWWLSYVLEHIQRPVVIPPGLAGRIREEEPADAQSLR